MNLAIIGESIMRVRLDRGTALVVVDVQNDFCPDGALPVKDGDKVIPVLNQYIQKFHEAHASIFLTRDWHPPNHVSFKAQGGPWPPHCIQGTNGAKFHPNLFVPPEAEIISKAGNPKIEAYSFFQQTDVDLAEQLRARGIRRLLVGGLATDYCVKHTVLDSLREGFETFLLGDACRGVNVNPDDSKKAVEEMFAHGAQAVTIDRVEV